MTTSRHNDVSPQQAARLAKLMVEAPAFICTLTGPDHVFDFANDRYHDLAGRRELLGRPVRAVFPELEHQGFFELLDEVLRTGDPFVGREIPVPLRRNGLELEIRHLNFVYQAVRAESGEITGIFVHGVDVTDLVAGRNALREKEQQLARQNRELAELASSLERQKRLFDTTLSSIVDFAYVFDLEGRFLYVNRALLDLWGLTLEQALGKNFHELPYPEDLASKLQSQIRQVIETRSRVTDETPYTNPAGATGYYEYIFVPVFGDDGRIEAVAGSTREISARKRIEAQLEQAHAEAVHLGQLKDEFLATLSHELRTPLSAILGWAHVLERGHSTPETREGIAAIHRNARLQAQLIDDLLDLSRIESGKMRLEIQRLNLADVILAAVQSMKPAADAKGIELDTTIATAQAMVAGDPNRLQQIVWNLLSNAVKFTDSGGEIRVSLRADAGTLELAVTDTGRGIAADFLPYAFERFRQQDASTTRSYAGLGIGLALVKQLVELHGGTVRAESPGEGRGATFTVRLPAHTGGAASRRHKPSQSPAGSEVRGARLDHVKLLMVDDDPDMQTLTRLLFDEFGAAVSIASDAVAGLQMLKTERPDVVLCDIQMPGHDGYQFISWVRALPSAEGGATPAVAVTAFARQQDRERALASGYQSHLAKPIDPAEFVAVVRRLAGGAE